MNYTSYFRKHAQEDLDAAYLWYEKQRAGLGDEFCDELRKAVERIEVNPEGFAKVFGEFRRLSVHRFPYALLYFVRGERIEIVAVYHMHRDPDGLKARLRSNGAS